MPQGLKKRGRILQQSEETSCAGFLIFGSLILLGVSLGASNLTSLSQSAPQSGYSKAEKVREASFCYYTKKKKKKSTPFSPVAPSFILNVERTKILWHSLCKK